MTDAVMPRYMVAFSLAGEQRDLVRAVAEIVKRELGEGRVFLDEWFEYLIAGQDADVKLQQLYSDGCELVVVCVSKNYGEKSWTLAEHEAIRARYMEARVSQDPRDRYRILPIRVGEGDVPGLPFNAIIPDVRKRAADDIAKMIILRLREIVPDTSVATETPGAEWPEAPPELRWPMADHTGVRQAFATLLTRAATSRCLLLRGPSEAGKSHITRQMLTNALRIEGLDCGRLDFKGTTDIDAALRAFVQDLNVQLPPTNPRFSEYVGGILMALRRRGKPALLICDTYEAASGEAQEWLDKELLPTLIRATWLRVVIAGQRTPERIGSVWEQEAAPVLELKPPPVEDWYQYGKQHRPNLQLSQVETVCELALNKASVIAQLLGPVS
jgi:hypothetical protein